MSRARRPSDRRRPISDDDRLRASAQPAPSYCVTSLSLRVRLALERA
jgi:hypothetical protein